MHIFVIATPTTYKLVGMYSSLHETNKALAAWMKSRQHKPPLDLRWRGGSRWDAVIEGRVRAVILEMYGDDHVVREYLDMKRNRSFAA